MIRVFDCEIDERDNAKTKLKKKSRKSMHVDWEFKLPFLNSTKISAN